MTQTSTGTLVEVDTAAGRVRGAWRGEPGAPDASAAFLGIPFAEAPVGELRFAAPVPKAPWEGVRDALEFGATAQRGDPGVTLIPEPSVPGESTLNVNVFTPRPADAEPGEGLPVLVWIHGGGYFAGSPASPWYDGRQFNRDGVVTVSISYRLGFDGFGWIADAPSNRGVRDWLLALEWVRDNIARFGGDPSRVTIGGQSAGGGAVLTLLGMPSAQHLFHGVWCVSGAIGGCRGRPLRAHRTPSWPSSAASRRPVRASARSARSGSSNCRNWRPSPPMAIWAPRCRRCSTMGSPSAPRSTANCSCSATIDSIASGVGADKPLVLGATDDEFAMAVADAKNKLRFVPKSMLLKKMGLSKPLVHAYLGANRDLVRRGTAAVLGRYITDRMFRVFALRLAGARGAAPTWLYRFSWRSARFDAAVHCIDVPFFFDCLTGADNEAIDRIAGSNPPQALADTLHADAVAFITSGHAGWPRFRDAAATTRVYDTPSTVVDDGYASVRPLLTA